MMCTVSLLPKIGKNYSKEKSEQEHFHSCSLLYFLRLVVSQKFSYNHAGGKSEIEDSLGLLKAIRLHNRFYLLPLFVLNFALFTSLMLFNLD